MVGRVQHQSAYVLHLRAYSESSWLVDAFSQQHGRVSLLAKGARRLKSRVRGLLRPFQPLLISWTGKSELQILTSAEINNITLSLDQPSWLCGSYINELILKLLYRHDPHEKLFDAYDQALKLLSGGAEKQLVLRVFEKTLLDEIGYGMQLEKDINNQPILKHKEYDYFPDKGPVMAVNGQSDSLRRVSGATLIALAREDFNNQLQMEQSKRLMRIVLDQCLQGRELKSRNVLQNIRALR